MLRRAAVVHGHGHHAGRGHEGVEVVVVRRGEGGLDDEAAAVVVDEDGDLLVGGAAGQVRQVEPRRQVGSGVDQDVLGGDASGRVESGGENLGADKTLDPAALVDANEGWRVDDDFVVGVGVGVHGSMLSLGRWDGSRDWLVW